MNFNERGGKKLSGMQKPSNRNVTSFRPGLTHTKGVDKAPSKGSGRK